MADLPRLGAEDLLAACAPPPGAVVLAPDRRGRHTNLLRVPLPTPFPTAFGDPRSLAVHRRRAQAAGRPVVLVDRPGLAHDLDLPDDLEPGLP